MTPLLQVVAPQAGEQQNQEKSTAKSYKKCPYWLIV